MTQVVITNQMSLKLFGPDNRPTNWSRDAEALLVPTISDQCLPFEVDVSRVLLYYSDEGERCVGRDTLRRSSTRPRGTLADTVPLVSHRLAHLVSTPIPTQARSAAFTMDVSTSQTSPPIVGSALNPRAGPRQLLGPCDYPAPADEMMEDSPS